MEKPLTEKFEQAMRECVDDGMKKVVYNDIENEFSFLELTVGYSDQKGAPKISPMFDPETPNAFKYNVLTHQRTETGESFLMIWIVEDNLRMEKVIQILKKVHGIKDPWDDDPDYFKTHKPGDEL